MTTRLVVVRWANEEPTPPTYFMFPREVTSGEAREILLKHFEEEVRSDSSDHGEEWIRNEVEAHRKELERATILFREVYQIPSPMVSEEKIKEKVEEIRKELQSKLDEYVEGVEDIEDVTAIMRQEGRTKDFAQWLLLQLTDEEVLGVCETLGYEKKREERR